MKCIYFTEPSKKDDPTYDREKEIKEIEGLIPEIREKIVDTKDMKAETFKKIGDRRLLEDAFAAAASANNDKNGKFLLIFFSRSLGEPESIMSKINAFRSTATSRVSSIYLQGASVGRKASCPT